MPQPKKPGSSGRKPPARKSAAPKLARGREVGRAQRPAGTADASGRRPAAGASAAREARAEQRREDQLHAAAASVRDLLSRAS